MNTISNYGCTILYTKECENLSGGSWHAILQAVLQAIRYTASMPGIAEAIDERASEFIEGFKEGWEAAKQ